MVRLCALLAAGTLLAACDPSISVPATPLCVTAVRWEPGELDPTGGRQEVGPRTDSLIVSFSTVLAAPTVGPDAVELTLRGAPLPSGALPSSGIARLSEDDDSEVVFLLAEAPTAGNYRVDLSPAIRSLGGLPVDPEAGCSAFTVPFDVETFSAPPGEPRALSARPLSPTSIEVDWEPATDNRTPASELTYEFFIVEAGEPLDASRPERVVPADAVPTRVVGLEPRTAYLCAVLAVDALGNRGKLATIKVTTPEPEPEIDETPPGAVSMVVVESLSLTSLRVRWSASTDDVDPPEILSYRVLFRLPGEMYDVDLACETSPRCESSGPGVTELVLSGLAARTTYHVVVQAMDSSGNVSGLSDEVTAVTDVISFAEDVLPILTENARGGCTRSTSCHAGGRPAAGLNLESHAFVDSVRPIVVPGEEIGPLMQSLLIRRTDTSLDNFIGPRMPLGLPALPGNDITDLKEWIHQGALDN